VSEKYLAESHERERFSAGIVSAIIPTMSLLIKNIQLIDGSGKPAVKADVLVRAEKIAAIGNFPNYKAEDVIDGFGAYLCPGFINIDADADHYLRIFSNPKQENYLEQGITTIIGGQAGASLAPLIYGSLESIADWADIRKINVNWHTMKEFLLVMEKRPLGVNFGTLVGHTTIRQALIGEDTRSLSRNELAVLNSVLDKSLKQGAFGVSTGLDYIYNRDTSYNEIKSAAEIAAKNKKIYATRLRDEKRGIVNSINEKINVAKETGAKVLINHFRPVSGYGKEYDEALNLINKNSDRADIYFDISPSETSYVVIYDFLPRWAQSGDKKVMLKDIETPGLREKILREIPRLKGEETIIAAPMREYLIGKSLKSFSENRNLSVGEGLLALMKLTHFRATLSYKNIAARKAVQALSYDRAIIASINARKILDLTEKKKHLPLELAIHKMTALPAKRIGVKLRGLVKENYFADLVIFKDAKIREVVVNGKRAVRDGKCQEELAGKILRHEA